MTDDDIWVKSAMDDTDLVAQILIKLRQSSLSSSSHLKRWTFRQRRSKPQVVDPLPPPKPPATGKKPPATRASPTSPLSWSGATSVSGGGGIEESSRLIHDNSRSKVLGLNETTTTKRSRKKKTLAELKEEEMILLKERKQLKQQLEALQARYQNQKKENESLNKIKNNLQSQRQVCAAFEINDSMEGKKKDGFELPDLNFPAGEDY